MNRSSLNSLLATLFIILSSVFITNAQINTACTASIITSFTPCMNFVTGSIGGSGSSPTRQCCDSLKTLFTDSIDCTCLIVTGNVPVTIPFINSTLAVSLPQACGSSVPLQCRATGVPLPAPGPALFVPTQAPTASAPNTQGQGLAPTQAPTIAPAPAPHTHRHRPAPTLAPAAPPHHKHSPKASTASAVATPAPVGGNLDSSPTSTAEQSSSNPTAKPGSRPVVQQNSASNIFIHPFPLSLVLLGFTVFM